MSIVLNKSLIKKLNQKIIKIPHKSKQGKFNNTWEGVAAKYGGAVAMYGIGKLIKKKYKVSEDARVDLYKACNDWIDVVSTKGNFLGGEKPNLADVSMYGVLLVMENLQVWDDLLSNSNIKNWFYSTKKHVENNDGLSLFVSELQS